MAPDLPEKLLGIDIGDADSQRRESDESEEEEAQQCFVFVGLGEHKLAIPVDDVRTITDVPDELTRVPRSPPAIEGLTDLRGDITAVIDPQIHFPTTEDRTGREQLLVFDRPTDEQSAAIRVDQVIDVETVPEANVLDEAAIEEHALSGDAFEHPLVAAIVEQEYEPEIDSGSVVRTEVADSAGAGIDVGSPIGAGGVTALSSGQRSSGSRFGSVGETFEIEVDDGTSEAEETTDGTEQPREIVVEATAVLDVEKLLLASGHGV